MKFNVYVLMPVAKKERAAAAAGRWMKRGYRMLFYQNKGTEQFTNEVTLVDNYFGVWNACNKLALLAQCLDRIHKMDACVFAGDDMEPDPMKTANEICREYLDKYPDGEGVMQPSGDPQGVDASGLPAAGRICGSAWFGRDWIERSYGGRGPTNAAYWHFYADEELALVAAKLGLLWWRPDLSQMHLHWSWGHMPRQDYHERNQQHWDDDKALFLARQGAGFPGHELKAKEVKQ